jgi:PAS domain S-box-containing protein
MTEQKTVSESYQKQEVTETGGKPRKTGINVIGDVPWGTHLCQFYQTKKDLIDILVPYFKAGLENNEFCMWVTSEPVSEKDAKEAMRKAVPDFEQYLKRGQIEVVPHTEWYLKDGAFNLQRVLNAWIDKLNQALTDGYDGIRVTGNTAWIEKRDWKSFADYEETVNNAIGQYRMIAICTYFLDKCGASEVIDVVKNHQFALTRREGKWELIESSERKQAKKALSETNTRLQVLQQVTAAVHSTLNLEKVFKEITNGAVHSLGYSTVFILMLNNEKRCFEVKSLSTKTRLLPQIDKILRFPLRNLSVPADPELNAVMGAIMNGRVAAAKTLAEVAYPLMSKKTCFALQKLARTKNYIVVPLPSKIEGDVVGALFISSPRHGVSEEELAMIQNFARAASQAIRNANLHTQTKQAEEALRESEEKLRQMFESVTDGIAVANLNGVITEVNDRAVQMHGFGSKDELVGKSGYELIAPYDRERAAVNMRKALKQGPVRGMEYTLLKADGSEFPGELSASVLRSASGNHIGSITIARDITERKKAEEREKRLQQELNLASRLASIGQMASGIAHEINNPLTSVIGFSQLLLSQDIPDDIREDLEVIDSEAQRVARIIAGLLAFARQRKPEREYVDINTTLSRVLELRSHQMEVNNIQVETRLTSDLPQSIADAGQLEQVFLNIILNAEKEMTVAHKGGKLSIKTEKIDDTIRVSFTDDGPGISKENLDKIFDPFFTTREVGEGTGLGLSVCHSIITAHNGRIYAESELGKGATFVVELPIVADAQPVENSEVIEEELQRQDGAKILVVDDETVILDLLKDVLTEDGYEVETADRTCAALERLHSKKYDLILLDIKLPVMSGIELYRHIESVNPALAQRVVFITGDVMETSTKDFLDKTGVSYIAKPFDIELLKQQINHILAKALERQRT